MADVKWVRVAIEMFNDPKIKIINSMEQRDLIINIWMRAMLLAGRSNKDGCLFINDSMPYNLKTLAVEFDRTLDEVKLSFKVLRKLEMIEFTENKVFKVKNWARHQNIEGLEKLKKQNCERVAKHRARKKKLNENENNVLEDNNHSSEESNFNNFEIIDTDIKENNNDNTFLETDMNKNIIEKDTLKNNNNYSNSSEQQIRNVTYIKINDDIKSVKSNFSNITSNDKVTECSINVMEQNKNKKKIKKKIKNEKKNKYKEIENKVDSISNLKINNAAIELSQYCENITGIMSNLNIGSLNLAISMHGKENVKSAINRAIANGRVNMQYINGILKNWRKEGYPEDEVGGTNNGAKSNGKSGREDSNEFKGIKPKKCRGLTEDERRNISAVLI